MNNNNNYLTSQLITYIGNKRKLLSFIDETIVDIKSKLRSEKSHLCKDKLDIFDGFSGSGCVSRLLKSHASHLIVNDLEGYCQTLSQCYLANKSKLNLDEIHYWIDYLNKYKFSCQKVGFIRQNYAPKNDNDIRIGERVFYTNNNARIIDNVRVLIDKVPIKYKPFVLAPLLVKASIHCNTSGVFKGFHKKNGIGHFGGAGENALKRIKGEITLDYPVFSDYECEITIHQQDINTLCIPKVDIAYYDPPYNQHPYGSNYFMLNIINDYDEPEIQNGVSGIIKDWNRSPYNSKSKAIVALDYLIKNTDAKYIVISYNNEGIIPVDEFSSILKNYGTYEVKEMEYNTYRGSRNLSGRNNKVKEMLWVLFKKTS